MMSVKAWQRLTTRGLPCNLGDSLRREALQGQRQTLGSLCQSWRIAAVVFADYVVGKLGERGC